ncbi:MAG: Hsp20/alpha crystallin family protein [Elusimicrobia bacterium]|nr:Hsp20/alpha crystallin family protein [Elusimicrobiota bacterium]
MARTELVPARREFNPFRDIVDMERSFNQMFESFCTPPSARGGNGERVWLPELDLQETDEELIVQAAVPGVDKKDISIDVTENTLSIRGERKEVREEKGKTWVQREQDYGTFYRSIHLPASVDAERVKAMDKNGVLEIHLPKTEKTKARHVVVE